MQGKYSHVIVIGGGIAGLTAALRLAQRGFRITVIEQGEQLGGKLGARWDRDTQQHHEHSYHMYLNWYLNFWDIIDELGIRDQFAPRHHIQFLRKGEFPHTTSIVDVGSPQTIWQNIFSGVIPPADMFLYAYSLLDLVTQSYRRDSFLDKVSVNGFMSSRAYASEHAAEQHSRTLTKAFASYSYRTSAASYQRFIALGANHPSPMMWILKGDVHSLLIRQLEVRLVELGVRFQKLTRVDKITLGRERQVKSLAISRLERLAKVGPEYPKRVGEGSIDVRGQVVCAIPPDTLAGLVDDQLLSADDALGRIARLRSEPIASLDLHFKRRLEGIPSDHVVLMHSPHELTFIDNSQLWPGYDGHTYLNVVASDADHLKHISTDTALSTLLAELREYVPFEWSDIDFKKTRIRYNTDEPLFVNEVGSWANRPQTLTKIPNLFLAGDFCQHDIDVVTIEGAVVSGLNAAQAIVQRTNMGPPISIKKPQRLSRSQAFLLKAALAPYAYWAKTMTIFDNNHR